MILKIKGKDTEQDKTKRAFLDEGVRAVNNHAGFGKWHWAVFFDAHDLELKIQSAGSAWTMC